MCPLSHTPHRFKKHSSRSSGELSMTLKQNTIQNANTIRTTSSIHPPHEYVFALKKKQKIKGEIIQFHKAQGNETANVEKGWGSCLRSGPFCTRICWVSGRNAVAVGVIWSRNEVIAKRRGLQGGLGAMGANAVLLSPYPYFF